MFRIEAVQAKRQSLHGGVHLAPPLSWQVIGYGLLGVLIITMTFLVLGSYARVETVVGKIVPDAGAAVITPTRNGIVTRLYVSEDDIVAIGTPLVDIRAEEVLLGGGTGPERIDAALADEDARLAAQQRSTNHTANVSRARYASQAAGLRNELVSLDGQLALQRRLIDVASAAFNRVKDIAGKGYITKRDLEDREQTMLSRQQQLAALEQTRAEKVATLAQTLHEMDEAIGTAHSATAGIAGARADIASRRYNVAAGRGYTLTAPIGGVVTAVTARLGQPVQPGISLLTVIPASAHLEAQLYVPTRAAGFLAKGQQVRLQIDAYPYQRYGAVMARITKISTAAVVQANEAGRGEPVYLVTAALTKPIISTPKERRPLQVDMTLTARIITERRSLAEWLFEPIMVTRQR
jgi:membrane fusion protein